MASISAHDWLWLVPSVVAIIAFAWVSWPRPKEWDGGNGLFSWPSGMIYLPARLAVSAVAILVALLIWRW